MNCPFCGDTKSKVTNKRSSPEGVRRRRECLKCGRRYTTYENVVESEIYVIKKDKSRQRFDLEKIKRALDRAFEKRAIPRNKIEEIADSIEQDIRRKGKKEIESRKLGEMVMNKIKKIDKVAYVRFASVYREFKEIDDFIKEIKSL